MPPKYYMGLPPFMREDLSYGVAAQTEETRQELINSFFHDKHPRTENRPLREGDTMAYRLGWNSLITFQCLQGDKFMIDSCTHYKPGETPKSFAVVNHEFDQIMTQGVYSCTFACAINSNNGRGFILHLDEQIKMENQHYPKIMELISKISRDNPGVWKLFYSRTEDPAKKFFCDRITEILNNPQVHPLIRELNPVTRTCQSHLEVVLASDANTPRIFCDLFDIHRHGVPKEESTFTCTGFSNLSMLAAPTHAAAAAPITTAAAAPSAAVARILEARESDSSTVAGLFETRRAGPSAAKTGSVGAIQIRK